MYMVAGVSGNTGKVVAETLLSQNQPVTVLVRDAAKGAPWAAKGAHVATTSLDDRAGLTAPKPRTPAREVTLLQRKTSMIGKDLGKTSGWAHRLVLKQSGVTQIAGVTYDRVDDAGLHYTRDGVGHVLAVDHVVL